MAQLYCKYCGGTISRETKLCTSCGKQYFRDEKAPRERKGFRVLVFIIAIASIIMNVLQYNHSSEIDAEYLTMQSTISQQAQTIEELKTTSDHYNQVISFLKSDDAGYASTNFNASESLIITRKYSGGSFELTAPGYSPENIQVSQSDPSIADIHFEDESWYKTTNIIFYPTKAGIDIITFSNNLNEESFRVMIIVE